MQNRRVNKRQEIAQCSTYVIFLSFDSRKNSFCLWQVYLSMINDFLHIDDGFYVLLKIALPQEGQFLAQVNSKDICVLLLFKKSFIQH